MLGKIVGMLPRKVWYVLVATVLGGLGSKFPQLPLPSTDFVIDAAIALLACHTLTDVVHLAMGFLKYSSEQKALPGKSA